MAVVFQLILTLAHVINTLQTIDFCCYRAMAFTIIIKLQRVQFLLIFLLFLYLMSASIRSKEMVGLLTLTVFKLKYSWLQLWIFEFAANFLSKSLFLLKKLQNVLVLL
jgi:hypothetical protein